MIPVNSIVIPEEFVELCHGWRDGPGMFYAVSTTGNLTTGDRRPRGCDTDEQWYLILWRDLSRNVFSAVRMSDNNYAYPDQDRHEDHDDLLRFDTWVVDVILQLERSYGLEDWAQ